MKPITNFPNVITASRILLTPVFLWLMLSNDGVLVQLSAAVFIVAAVSDWYDGWYARRYNAMSAFGTFFDPLADKIFVGAAFFAFAALGIFPFWMVSVIVGRDVLLTVIRVIADRKGQPVVTSRLAKWKTAAQLVYLWYVVAAYSLSKTEWVRDRFGADVGETLFSFWFVQPPMVVLVLLSVITAVHYLIENRHVLGFSGRKELSGKKDLARSSS